MSLLFPPTCAICQCDAPHGTPLCECCAEELDALACVPTCPCCAKPVGDGNGPCPWCDGAGIGRIKRMACLGVYDGPLRELVQALKYGKRWEVAAWLGQRLSRQPAVQKVLAESDVLVPVPLHRSRQAHRGFNQSALLARHVARGRKLPVIQPTVRDVPTAAQAGLRSAVARQANVRDAFIVLDPHQIRGRRVTIVDDVTTTGATIRSLATAIHHEAPAAISAIVLAVADPRRRAWDEP